MLSSSPPQKPYWNFHEVIGIWLSYVNYLFYLIAFLILLVSELRNIYSYEVTILQISFGNYLEMVQ